MGLLSKYKRAGHLWVPQWLHPLLGTPTRVLTIEGDPAKPSNECLLDARYAANVERTVVAFSDPNDFSQASWTKFGCTTPDANTIKDTNDGAPTTHKVKQEPDGIQALPCWVQVDAEAGTQPGVMIASDNVESWAKFNLSSGVVVGYGGNCDSATIEDLGGGRYRCRAHFPPRSADKSILFFILNSSWAYSYQGDGTGTIRLYNASVEQQLAGAARDLSVSREEEFDDPDMEAVGVGSWVAYGGTPTKETGTPYEGVQCLRTTIAAPDTVGGCNQDTQTVGMAYRRKGWGRGDGVNGYPEHRSGAGTIVWSGTTANTWQEVDCVYVAVNSRAIVYCHGAPGAVDYAEHDLLSRIRCCDFIQTTAAKKPELVTMADGLKALKFTSTSDHHLISALAVNGSAGTVLVRFRRTSNNQIVVGARDSGVSEYCALFLKSGTGEVRCDIGDTLVSTGVIAADSDWCEAAFAWDSGSYVWYVDGSTGSGSYTGTLPTSPLFWGGRNDGAGGNSFAFDGHSDICRIAGRGFTATEMAAFFAMAPRT